jgi:hypothetical protein
MNSTVFLFVLVATATSAPASGRVSWQTVGYYATAAECQMALLEAQRTMDRSHVRLDCQPVKAVE